MNRLSIILAACCMLAFALPAQPRAADSQAAQKKTVTTVADLPVFTYKVPAQLDTLLTSDAAWAPFAAAMRSNLQGLLRDYAITDRKTLQAIERDLMLLDLDANRNTEARARLARVLDLEDKPDAKTFSTDTFLVAAILDARRASGASDGEAYRAALTKAYSTNLAALPDSVSAHVARVRGVYELASPDLAITAAKAQLAPQARKNGNTVGSEAASFLVWLRALHRSVLPTRPELLPALAAHLTAHPPLTADIWATRDVALDEKANLTPVTIAIWDSGIDAALFPGRMFVDADARNNGGAELHGIAFDMHNHRSGGMLYPVGGTDRAQFTRLIEENRVTRDLRAGIDNEQTRALKARVQAMTAAQLANEERLTRLFMGYWHGTSVANMAAAGNPAARLLSSRMTWDADPAGTPKVVFDDTWTRDFATLIADSVAYFKAHGARVVNMSWMLTADEIADNLRRAGVIKDEAERRRVANARLATIRTAMQSAFAGAPEILFVAGAGNDDNDAAFHESLPGTIDLPNVLAVGAVDQTGAAASFTSFGKNVSLYAKGVDLEALVPGGARIVTSGTSFAAPQVVNLAGKLLATNPKLSTAEVVALIRQGATKGEDNRLVLINPRHSLELLSQTSD